MNVANPEKATCGFWSFEDDALVRGCNRRGNILFDGAKILGFIRVNSAEADQAAMESEEFALAVIDVRRRGRRQDSVRPDAQRRQTMPTLP